MLIVKKIIPRRLWKAEGGVINQLNPVFTWIQLFYISGCSIYSSVFSWTLLQKV